MAIPSEVKIEVSHRLDQEATDDLEHKMWRGIYTIWLRDELVARGKTQSAWKQPSTAELAAQREGHRLAEVMLTE